MSEFTAIVSAPPGRGKSKVAAEIAALLDCTTVVEEWSPGKPITPGALHLTNEPLRSSESSDTTKVMQDAAAYAEKVLLINSGRQARLRAVERLRDAFNMQPEGGAA